MGNGSYLIVQVGFSWKRTCKQLNLKWCEHSYGFFLLFLFTHFFQISLTVKSFLSVMLTFHDFRDSKAWSLIAVDEDSTILDLVFSFIILCKCFKLECHETYCGLVFIIIYLHKCNKKILKKIHELAL